MRLFRIVAVMLALLLAAACSPGGGGSETESKIENPDENINPTGMPIVKEKTTIKFMTAKKGINLDDWNKVENMQKMEELSNIHIDWGLVPDDGAAEKVNLALASGEYPEVIFRTGLSSVDLAKYGEQGVFIPLNDLIDKYMPNLKALLEENPELRQGMTFPDGNIYGMPTIYDPEFESLTMQQKLWVRKDWLEKFGMEIPTTIEEYEKYLEAVKTKDPNGNGKADEIPASDGSEGGLLYQMLRSTFEVANRGTSSGLIDAQPDDPSKVRFYPTSDGYRELMEYMNRLYSKGLIQKDVFTNDAEKFNSVGSEGVYGSVSAQAPIAYFGKEVGKNYVAVPPLKKTEDSPVPVWNAAGASLRGMGQMVITDKAEHPIETARWMDYFYGDEGTKLWFMGIEGKSYEEVDGGYEFTEEITDNPEGLTVDEALRPYVVYLGGSYPGIVRQAYFKGTENSDQAVTGTKKVSDQVIEEIWPAFTYASEEASEFESIATDVDKFTEESRSGFISGKKPLSEWDSYVSQYDQMGIDRYLEIQQAAYDRYQQR